MSLSFTKRYREGVRESWACAIQRAALPMCWRPLWLLLGTVAFLAILWYVGSGIDTRHFFT